MVQNPDVTVRYISELGNVYYAKICFLEALNTFMFVLVYLFLIYKPSLRLIDELMKAIVIGFVLWISFEMCAGSGASLNPAFAIA
jgi:glycerol uptake facilitator-like aquaporin